MPKQPQAVLNSIFAFPPNRDTLGATAYLIVEKDANILVDCPAWDEANRNFVQQQGGVRWLFLTHRGAIAKVDKIQADTGCEIIIEQHEAYLLPGLEVTAFEQELEIGDRARAIWTPGHSPGSSCLYYDASGGILFSGRHLLPDRDGQPAPLRTAKTFHWSRQLRSVRGILDRFAPETLSYIVPAANTGFLRGKRAIENAYEKLAGLDLKELSQTQPLM
jgi:glyoxylase-like metal-dependent hydrolase (beta-lactamase superfamily II)